MAFHWAARLLSVAARLSALCLSGTSQCSFVKACSSTTSHEHRHGSRQRSHCHCRKIQPGLWKVLLHKPALKISQRRLFHKDGNSWVMLSALHALPAGSRFQWVGPIAKES